MSKTSQRRLSMYQQGLIDAKKRDRPRWNKHPMKPVYMAGWYRGKHQEIDKRRVLASMPFTRRFPGIQAFINAAMGG